MIAVGRTWRRIGLVLSAFALAGTFQTFVVPALRAYHLLFLQEDPAAIAEFKLRQLPPERFQAEIEAALDDDDSELAASLLEVTDQLAYPVDATLRQRIVDAQAFNAQRTLGDIWDGFAKGDASSEAGLGGALLADMTGAGDIRDLIIEGSAFLKGEEPDQVVLVISTVGVALTAGTYMSGGAGLPIRAGASVLKAAKKAGKMPEPLVNELTNLAKTSLNRQALDAAVDAAKRFDGPALAGAAGRILNEQATNKIKQAADDIASIHSKAGYRAVNQSLQVAESTADISKLRKLADATGKRLQGTLKLLGRAALEMGELMAKLIGWMTTALLWLLGAAWTLIRLFFLSVKHSIRAVRWLSKPRPAQA